MMTRLKSLIYIFILILMYAIYYWVVPIAVNIESRMPLIQRKIKAELGVQIDVKNPRLKMGLTPSVWLDASSFSVLDSHNKTLINVENPKIKIRILPLLIGKVNLAYLSGEKLNAKFKFDKNYRFYLGDYLIIDNSNPILSVENSKMNLTDYKITLKDELQNKNIFISGDYFNLDKFNSQKAVKFSINSNILVNKRSSTLNANIDMELPLKNNFKQSDLIFEGTLTNFNLADISPYIKKYSKNEILSASGLINIDAKTKEINSRKNRVSVQAALENLSVIAKNSAASVKFDDKLNFNSVFDISKNTLALKTFTIKAKRINAAAEGKISKITSKDPVLNLKIALNNTYLEDLVKLIPANKFCCQDIDFVALKKHGLFAVISGELKIKGKNSRPKIYGKMNAANLYVIKPLPAPIPKGNVILSFTGDNMDMRIKVPFSTSQEANINGIVELNGEKNSKLDIFTTPNVDLHVAQSILLPMHEIFKFELGPLPVMDLNGIGNINIKVKGNKTNPRIKGALNFKNASGSFNNIALLLTNVNGSLKFEDLNTRLVLDSVSANNKPIKLGGTCDLHGALSYTAVAKAQDLSDLYAILQNSPVLLDTFKISLPVKNVDGKADFTLKLMGKIKDLNDIKVGKSISVEGKIKLLGNNFELEKLTPPIKNVMGEINFKNTDVSLDIQSVLDKSKLKISGGINSGIANLSINSNLLYISDVLNCFNESESKKLKFLPSFSNTAINLVGKYTGSINKFDIDKVNLIAKILSDNSKKSELWLKSGNIELKNSVLKFSNLSGVFDGNSFDLSGSVSNFLKKNQRINATFISDDFNISALKQVSKFPFISTDFKKNMENFSDLNGKIDLKIITKNNSVSSQVALKDINLAYSPMELPLKIFSGSMDFKDDKFSFHKINAQVDSMPILIDGTVANVFKTPVFNIYINSKPTQKFIDKYINKKAIYPLKMKGDIIYSSRIVGTKNLFNTKTEVNLEQDANIYYMGSTLGDSSYPIRIFLDSTASKKFIEINNFQYQKLIFSQNNKFFVTPQLSAKGLIGLSKDNINLYNFKVKTQNPTDAKIFNMLFKKPVIKQGLFVSDIVINGPISGPKMLGELDFTGIDIPVFDTTIKDISLDFTNDNVDVKSSGEIFSNKLTLLAKMKNKLTPPYKFENIDIYCETFDINKITKSLNSIIMQDEKHKLAAPKVGFDLSNVIIEKAQLKADNVLVKNINAKNLLATLSLSEKMLISVNNFKFDVADGNVRGNFRYNLLNSNSSLDLKVDKVNANEMTVALFDLPSQIFGSLTGEANLTCNGKSHKTCMETLSGKGGFQVANGRMPKLGSLEYLLKASNLVKSGVTGLSINGIIDLVTPLKTGQFESISGNFNIDSGLANSIQIFSKGKDLSLFISGTYNFATVMADLDVFGRLSKKITNALGPIGNMSLNTLFNTIPGLDLDETNKAQIIKNFDKIPGLEFNEKLYRIFSVEIYGDINGDNYVKSFKWVE